MPRQTSFASGELAPALWGRSDLSRYASGARRLSNFIVNSMGNAVSRPGTMHAGVTRYSGDASKTVRLVPFLYTDAAGEEQGLALEFGHLYVRTPGGDVVTPYAAADLPLLTWAQSGDVLFLTHPSYRPQLLKRLAPTTWTLSPIDFSRPAPESGSGAARLVAPLPVADATHPAREWRWRVTTLVRGADGAVSESLPLDVATTITLSGGYPIAALPSYDVALYPDMPITVYWAAGAGLYGIPNYVVGWRVYRGRGGLYGYVGETTDTSFKDVGEEPDFTQQPPQARNPFEVKSSSGAVTGYTWPAACAFFAGRLVFGGGTRGAYVWASRVGDYYNFDRYEDAPEDALVELELAGRQRENTRWLLGLRQLLVGTSRSTWAVGSGDGSLTLQAAVQSEVGSSHLPPLVVGDDILFVRAKGAGVRAMRYSNQDGGYSGLDVSLLSRHLFDGHTIVDWCYQEDPDSIVWAVRDDGVLLSLTYQPASEVTAWTAHTLNGAVESVCSVPAGDEDAVYLVVRRGAQRFVERFASRRLPLGTDGEPDVVQCFSLDSAITSEGFLPDFPLSGFAHLEGKEVWAVLDGNVLGPLTVTAGQVALTGATVTSVAHVGVRFQPELEALDYPSQSAEVRGRSKLVRSVSVEVVASRGLWVGESFDKLREWRQRTVSMGYGVVPYETGTAEVGIDTTWNKGARVCLRQVDPLPLTVLGLNREVVQGD